MEKQRLMSLGLTAILVIGLVFISGCIQQESPTTPTTTQPPETPTTQPSTINFLTYENPIYGIRFKYPQDWTKKEGREGKVYGVKFSSPDTSDIFQESFGVLVLDTSAQPMTLDEYTRSARKGYEEANYRIIDFGNTTLANNPAAKIAYTEKTEQYQYIFMSIWTIKSDELYRLSYVARTDEYPKGLDKFDEMVNSFEIFNKTTKTTVWEVYRNDKYGFEVQYPSQYSVKEGAEKSVVSFWPTKESPYLVIWVLNNPENYTLEEFYNFYSLPENKEIREEEVGKTVYNYYESPDSIEPMEINGISAVKFIVGGQWRMTISIPYEGKIFEIHALPSAAEEKTFSQMLSTFKFIK